MATFVGRSEPRWSAGRVCDNGGDSVRSWQLVVGSNLISLSEIGNVEVNFCLPHRGKTRPWHIAPYGRDEGRLRGPEKLIGRGQRLRPMRVEPGLKNEIDIGMEGEKDRIARSTAQIP